MKRLVVIKFDPLSVTELKAWRYVTPNLPYFDKRKQLTKVTYSVNEQNVSVIYIQAPMKYYDVLT